MKKINFNYLFILLIISISLFLMLFLKVDSDYLWHISVGKYIYNNGIITHDVFSWYMIGKYWFSHEWGFELIIYLLKILFGKYHLFLYSFFNILILLLFIYFTNKEGFNKNKLFSLIWLSFALILNLYIVGRPHLISFIFIAITMYILYDLFNYSNSKKIYLLPLISLFWVNIHGGSSNLIYIFSFIFMFISLIDFKFNKIESIKKENSVILKYFIFGLLSLFIGVINPHGIEMISYPYVNMLDTLMLKSIYEWQPSNIGIGFHLPFFIISFIILSIMVLSNKKIRLIDIIIYIFILYLGLKSIRFWPFIYIIMSYSIFYYIPFRKEDSYTKETYFIVSFFLLISFMVSFNSIIKESNKNINLNKKIINIIKKENPKRLYNLYNFGGELIYNDIKVFIDGRADLYSKYNLKDALDISYLRGDYEKIINKYNFDYFLVSSEFSINTYLKYNNNYKLIYSNKDLFFYKKIK